MFELKFTGKPRKGGNSGIVTIPKSIYDLLKDQEYEFIIQEKEATKDADEQVVG